MVLVRFKFYLYPIIILPILSYEKYLYSLLTYNVVNKRYLLLIFHFSFYLEALKYVYGRDRQSLSVIDSSALVYPHSFLIISGPDL